MNKFTVLLCSLAFVAAAGCTKNDDGGGKENPAGEDFTVKEVCKQSRSAKRGLSGSFQLPLVDIPLVSAGVGWYYNWGNTCPIATVLAALEEHDIDFLPMIWNANYSADEIRKYALANPDAEYLLAFNEPNLTDQANMTPTEAASYWSGVRAAAANSGLKLISPALNYGTLAGYSDPVVWLDEFIACDGVSADDFEALALHCYMPNVGALRSYVRRFDKYGKPIFMTEFCHANGIITNNEYSQRTYMCDVLNYMECDPSIEGYSWFMTRATGNWAAVSILNRDAKNPALTDLGKSYVYFSSFDRNTYYGAGEAIPAEHYVSHTNSAIAADGVLRQMPRVKSSGDADSLLDLTDFYTAGTWVEYQLELAESRDYDLAIRYLGDIGEGTYNISIDGESIGDIVFPKSDGYKTYWVSGVSLAAGKHTMRLSYVSGRTDFNWFYLR